METASHDGDATMVTTKSLFGDSMTRYDARKEEEYSLQEYLEICKQDPSAYATSAERLLKAIGEPVLVDTRLDPALSRIFSNKVIRRYPAFGDFFGMEECIEQIVSYLRHAGRAQTNFIFIGPGRWW
jgi:serine protein kinase